MGKLKEEEAGAVRLFEKKESQSETEGGVDSEWTEGGGAGRWEGGGGVGEWEGEGGGENGNLAAAHSGSEGWGLWGGAVGRN